MSPEDHLAAAYAEAASDNGRSGGRNSGVDPDVEITQYRDVIAGEIFRHARIDVREFTEEQVTRRLEQHCERYGLVMDGPVVIDWSVRAEVRTRKAAPK